MLILPVKKFNFIIHKLKSTYNFSLSEKNQQNCKNCTKNC